MKCLECGKGTMRRRVVRVPHEVFGVSFEVEGMAEVCGACGFTVIPMDEVPAHGRLVDQAYRLAAGLLSAAEIRSARERLGMTQSAFAAYIGVGAASLKRWERGALLEKSSSELIRLKTNPEFAKRSLEALSRKLQRKPPAKMKIQRSAASQTRRLLGV